MSNACKLDLTVDEAVALSLKEELEFHEKSGSVRSHKPRVIVNDGGARALRRPFKLRGHWVVRWAGTARLVEAARLENGVIEFKVTWAW